MGTNAMPQLAVGLLRLFLLLLQLPLLILAAPGPHPAGSAGAAAFAVSPFCLTLILCHVAGVPAGQNALKLSHLSCRFKLAVAVAVAAALLLRGSCCIA